MVENYITFIYLFFVPAIAVCIMHRNKNKKEVLGLILDYAICVVISVFFSKTVTILIRYLFNLPIIVSDFAFGCIQIVVSIIIPIFYRNIQIKIEKIENKKKIKKKDKGIEKSNKEDQCKKDEEVA